jgi:phage-related protein
MKSGKILTYVNPPVNIQLVRIARDQWDVLAVLDGRGRCQVLDFLQQLPPSHTAAQRWMLQLLRLQLPRVGPPRHNVNLCKSLGGGVFELRRQPKGQKLRTLFFYDDLSRIVLTNAFLKAETTPRTRTEIALARSLKRRYFEAKFRHGIEIVKEG